MTYRVAMSRAAPAQDSELPRRGPRAWFLRTRDRVRNLPGGFWLWRIAVTVIGVLVVAVGIVLLPLPGPGWVIIFAGLGLLATEYAWAATLLRRVRGLLRRWSTWLAARPRWVQVTVTILGLLFLAAILLGVYLAYRSL